MSTLTLLQMFTPAAPPAPPATYASTVVGLAWVFFALAAALSLTGLWLLWRGVFRDPDRKLRRCSKCWYIMEGVPGLRCPECGRQHKDERRLHRRRRHQWVAATGLLVLLVAFATAWTPRVANRGWLGSVPTWGLILAAWVYDTEDGAVLDEAGNRVFGTGAWRLPDGRQHNPRPWGWMLHRSTRSALLNDVPQHGPVSPATITRIQLALDTLQGLGWIGRDVVPDYIAALEHPSPLVRGMATDVLPAVPNDKRVLPVVRNLLDSPAQGIFESAAKWLVKRAPADRSSDAAIASGLQRFPITGRDLLDYGQVGIDRLAQMLTYFGDDAETAQVLMLVDTELGNDVRVHALRGLSASSDTNGRKWCAALCGLRWPRDPVVHQQLVLAAREDPSPEVRHFAIVALSETSASSDFLLPVIIAGLSENDPSIRYFCTWKANGGVRNAAAAIPRLREIAADEREEPRTREAAAKAIASIEAATAATNP